MDDPTLHTKASAIIYARFLKIVKTMLWVCRI